MGRGAQKLVEDDFSLPGGLESLRGQVVAENLLALPHHLPLNEIENQIYRRRRGVSRESWGSVHGCTATTSRPNKWRAGILDRQRIFPSIPERGQYPVRTKVQSFGKSGSLQLSVVHGTGTSAPRHSRYTSFVRENPFHILPGEFTSCACPAANTREVFVDRMENYRLRRK